MQIQKKDEQRVDWWDDMVVDSRHKYYKEISKLKNALLKEKQKHFINCKKINDLVTSILDEDCSVCINYNKDFLCDKGLFTCMKHTTYSQFSLDLGKLKRN